MKTIPAFLASLSGGDLPADAVREERCLKTPLGCGKPLISPESVARLFPRASQAARYQAEYQITGLCPDCQDALDIEEADL
ncbi:hypothetical protein [Streptomyces sp. BH104]|uniref:hypothetical protein n=1 Tax=Streptomyces sp. BH104 TaxID=3410407 RepID=UPI003BB4CE77